jgi:xanthine dehydrogenase accessory factor
LNVFAALAAAIREEGAGALVCVADAKGSAPREVGARMVVRPSGAFTGTIGGGALEFEAMAIAAQALRQGRGPVARNAMALGPHLGQCCGGRVELTFETFDSSDMAEIEPLARAQTPFTTRTRRSADGRLVRELADEGGDVETFGEPTTPLLLFGAGHVGRALVLALAPLPFRVRWIDARPDAFPRYAPANVTLSLGGEDEIDAAPDGAFVIVMTHSHPLDLNIVSRALVAGRFGYVGLIGSATKRARFSSMMREAGVSEAALDRLTCPIGVPGIADKAPAAIAAAVAAQLLQQRDQ